MTFGSSISFLVSFSGPAIDSPTGTGGDSTFYFSTFAADGATPILTSDPNGVDAQITITAAGTTLGQPVSNNASVNAAPEPGVFGLVGFGLFALGALKRRFQ